MEVEPARILVVEDDPLNVELLQLALDRYNFVNLVEFLEDGEQALKYLLGEGENPADCPLPDLVLLDLRLPKIKGVQVLQEIRNNPRTQDLVVVALTTSRDDRELNACYALGINSYIVKPLDFERLICAMRQVGLRWMLLKSSPLPPP